LPPPKLNLDLKKVIKEDKPDSINDRASPTPKKDYQIKLMHWSIMTDKRA
jgi:hypothetical protein